MVSIEDDHIMHDVEDECIEGSEEEDIGEILDGLEAEIGILEEEAVGLRENIVKYRRWIVKNGTIDGSGSVCEEGQACGGCCGCVRFWNELFAEIERC